MEIVIFILVILIIGVIAIQYNSIMKLKQRVKQSRSGIDVYLQQRFNLIPNLVETVKGYMNYEKETLKNLTELRAQYNKTNDMKISQELNNKINYVIAVSEKYPELKASEQFLNLQKSLSKMESQLQAARRIYNNDVTTYNTKISVVPYNIVASIFRFKEEELFKIEDVGASKNINIDIE